MSLHRCFIKAIGLYFWSMCAGVQLQPQKYPRPQPLAFTHTTVCHTRGFWGLAHSYSLSAIHSPIHTLLTSSMRTDRCVGGVRKRGVAHAWTSVGLLIGMSPVQSEQRSGEGWGHFLWDSNLRKGGCCNFAPISWPPLSLWHIEMGSLHTKWTLLECFCKNGWLKNNLPWCSKIVTDII